MKQIIAAYLTNDSVNLLSFIECIPLQEQLRISQYKFESDKIKSLCGWLLIGMATKHAEITRDSHNRPILKGLDVNISHDGDVVICCCSVNRVGIDVMDNRQVYSDHFNKTRQEEIDFIKSLSVVLLPKEINFIQQDINKLYHIWTAKEAYLKYTGKGLIENVLVEYNEMKNQYFCQSLPIYHTQFNEYHLVASTIDCTITTMSIADIVDYYTNLKK